MKLKMLFRGSIGLALAILVSSCAYLTPRSQIALFPGDGTSISNNSEKSPAEVGVYRTIPTKDSFTELGLISFKSGEMNLPKIFDQLRVDAAKQGADAVVGVKIKSETHTETEMVHNCQPKTQCDANGVCTTQDECHDELVSKEVTTYLTEGSLVRRKL